MPMPFLPCSDQASKQGSGSCAVAASNSQPLEMFLMWCKQLACLQAAATMPCLCTQHAPSEGVSGLKASFVCLQALLRRTALPQSAWTGPTLTALWPLCPWMKGMRVWPPHLGRTTRPEWVRCRTELLPSRIRMWTKPSLLSGEGGSTSHAWSCLCRHMMATGCSAYRRVQCLTVEHAGPLCLCAVHAGADWCIIQHTPLVQHMWCK